MQLKKYGSYDVLRLDFHDFMDPAKTEKFLQACGGQYDIIIGSDVVYSDDVVTPLLATINALLKPKGQAVFATAVSRIPFGANHLFQRLKRKFVQSHGIYSIVTEMLTVEQCSSESNKTSGDMDIDKKWEAAIRRVEGGHKVTAKAQNEGENEKEDLSKTTQGSNMASASTNIKDHKGEGAGGERPEDSNVSIFGFDPREHDFLFDSLPDATDDIAEKAASRSKLKVIGAMPSKEKYVVAEFKKLY